MMRIATSTIIDPISNQRGSTGVTGIAFGGAQGAQRPESLFPASALAALRPHRPGHGARRPDDAGETEYSPSLGSV